MRRDRPTRGSACSRAGRLPASRVLRHCPRSPASGAQVVATRRRARAARIQRAIRGRGIRRQPAGHRGQLVRLSARVAVSRSPVRAAEHASSPIGRLQYAVRVFGEERLAQRPPCSATNPAKPHDPPRRPGRSSQEHPPVAADHRGDRGEGAGEEDGGERPPSERGARIVPPTWERAPAAAGRAMPMIASVWYQLRSPHRASGGSRCPRRL